MVRAEDGRIPGQVVEVVHDHSHEEVEHDERAQEDERHEVHVSHRRAARLAEVQDIACKERLDEHCTVTKSRAKA